MKPTVLIILDGFGHSERLEGNAVAQAKMPHYRSWLANYPHTYVNASGPAVGLPSGVIGNSEVGHLTIGAGKVVEQDVVTINKAIADGSFFENPLLSDNLQKLATANSALHLICLLSDADVHSTINHLFAYLKAAQTHSLKKVYVHALLDGRDVPQKSAAQYLEQLDQKIAQLNTGKIASLIGRFYAMDRDTNWQRTQQAYDLLVDPQPVVYTTWRQALEQYYAQGITDEFVPATPLVGDAPVANGDGIIFCNFRPDRARQLTQAFVDSTLPVFASLDTIFSHKVRENNSGRAECIPSNVEGPNNHPQLAFFITPTSYGNDVATTVLFKKKPLEHTLKDRLLAAGKTFFAIAETEKYAHVTYFFSGGKSEVYPNETRVLIPSLPFASFADCPEMSAAAITDAVLASLANNPKDFYLINYANADMVGHSGSLAATITALEFLDTQLARLYTQVVQTMDGTIYITADHGNAEEMIDPQTGQPKTSHTTNQVPFLALSKKWYQKKIPLPLSGLSDVAGFVMNNMN